MIALIAPPPETTGQLTVVGILIAALATVLGFVEARVVRLVDARLNQKSSPLGDHMADVNAHEAMRDNMGDRLEERFARLEAAMTENGNQFRADIRAFQADVIKPIMEQNAKTLQLLESLITRERRFEGHPRA
jgi:hypothetical protein